VGFLIGLATVVTLSYLNAQTGCDTTNTPPADPGGHAWVPNTPVTVNIDPSFDSGQQAAMQTVLRIGRIAQLAKPQE
jgi:hypothetical protein